MKTLVFEMQLSCDPVMIVMFLTNYTATTNTIYQCCVFNLSACSKKSGAIYIYLTPLCLHYEIMLWLSLLNLLLWLSLLNLLFNCECTVYKKKKLNTVSVCSVNYLPLALRKLFYLSQLSSFWYQQHKISFNCHLLSCFCLLHETTFCYILCESQLL